MKWVLGIWKRFAMYYCNGCTLFHVTTQLCIARSSSYSSGSSSSSCCSCGGGSNISNNDGDDDV